MAEGYTPAEDYTQDGYERNEDENIKMEDRDDWEQTQDGFAKPPEQETTFTDLPDAPETLVSIAKQDKIENYYKFLDDNHYRVDKDAQLKHNALFTLGADKKLGIIYKGETIWLSKLRNPSQFLLPDTIVQKYGKGGKHFVRNVLGISVKPLEVPPKQRKELLNIDSIIDLTKSSPERQLEEIEMQTVEQVEEGLNTFLETSTQTELALGPPGSLQFRELAGLDRSLRNMRTTVLKITSEREVKKARVKELKDEISKVAYDEDGEVQFSEDLREKQREIKTLEEEIETLDSVIREYDGKFRGQFERIKQTIDKMLNQDMTLGERIQTLFREQGITITSVITALGLAIGMIINSILSAAKSIVPPAPPAPTPKPTPPAPTPKPEPTPPAPTPGIKGWIKEQLRNIANLLLKLADKM